MPNYKTRQRALMTEFLAGHPDEILSARAIAAGLSGEPVSLSAVYRNLSRMEREGIVCRVNRPGSRETYFRYLAESCKHCLHLSCKRCGKTYHMDGHGEQALLRVIKQSEHFTLDRSETVLYGVCGHCQDKNT